MITGIKSVYFSMQNYNNYKFATKKQFANRNYNLNVDTVSFSGNKPLEKLVEDTVNLALKKVQETSGNPILREYLGVTKDNINVRIQETALGENAILTIINGDLSKKHNNALYEVKKIANEPAQIISLYDLKPNKDIKSIEKIKHILENLK